MPLVCRVLLFCMNSVNYMFFMFFIVIIAEASLIISTYITVEAYFCSTNVASDFNVSNKVNVKSVADICDGIFISEQIKVETVVEVYPNFKKQGKRSLLM